MSSKTTTAPSVPTLTSEQVTAPIFDLPDKYQENPEQLKNLLERVKALRIDIDNPIAETETLVRIETSPILKVGSLMFVSGQAGSRKTTALTLLAADCIRPNHIPNSPFNVARPLKVLFIDPEQHPADTQKINQRCARLIGEEYVKSYLSVYPLVSFPTTEIPIIVEELIKTDRPDIVIVDNVMQMGNGAVMDIDKAEILLRNLRRLAVQYNAAFIGVIHTNETGDKKQGGRARGHGGSEATREADLVVNFVEDESETLSVAHIKKSRWKKPAKWAVSIDENGTPIYVDAPTETETKSNNPDTYREIAESIGILGLSHSELKQMIIDTRQKSETTAKKYISAMLQSGVIAKVNGRYYSASNAPENEATDQPF